MREYFLSLLFGSAIEQKVMQDNGLTERPSVKANSFTEAKAYAVRLFKIEVEDVIKSRMQPVPHMD